LGAESNPGAKGNVLTVPRVLCSFAESEDTENLDFALCYEDITKRYCEEKVEVEPAPDVGTYKCSTNNNGVDGGEAGGCIASVNGNDDVCCTDPLTKTYAPKTCNPLLVV
jgi:hypothetical protein